MTTVLEAEGQRIHPASRWLANESAHVSSEAGGHDLHCFQTLRRMDEILLANFMVFQEVVEEGHYVVVIGDEAWDVDYYWHENPELKRGQNVWLTDFVGYLPITAISVYFGTRLEGLSLTDPLVIGTAAGLLALLLGGHWVMRRQAARTTS